MQDRAADPACQEIRAELTERILDGWSPAAIAPVLAQKRAETKVLRQWANQTRPAEQYRWPLSARMNRLDDWPPAHPPAPAV
jgi:hypothetical protein